MTDPNTPVDMLKWLEELRVSVSESVGGMALRGARPIAIGGTTGATKRPTTSAGALVGYAIRNLSTSEGAQVLVLFREGGPDGDVILPLALAPGESARDWFGPGGIHLGDGGLYMDITGNVDGSVFLRGVE